MLSQDELKYFHLQGLIPAPTETEEEFLERAHYCLKIDEKLVGIPFSQEARGDGSIIKESHPLTKKLFGIAPTWIPLYFSNHQLSPWHGGCAWIVQLDDKSPTTALFQLRQKFKTKENVGGYTRQETIAHELSHVGRMSFNEPKFEEILAYRTSHSPFRRWFGPIIQSSRESLMFVILLLVVLILDGFSLFGGHPIMMWPKVIPLLFIALAALRLTVRHLAFSKCLKLINSMTPYGNAVIYCLTDREIADGAKMTPEQFRDYVALQSTPRWQLINALATWEKGTSAQ